MTVLVQSARYGLTSGTSFTITPTTPLSASNLAILDLKFNAAVTGVTVVDNLGNTYLNTGVAASWGGAAYALQWYGVQLVGGATSITVSWTTATGLGAVVSEYSGLAATNASVFDKAVAANAYSNVASASIAPSVAGGLVVFGLSVSPGYPMTASAGYTVTTTAASNYSEAFYKPSGTTSETPGASLGGTANWAMVAGSYRLPASSVTGTGTASGSGTAAPAGTPAVAGSVAPTGTGAATSGGVPSVNGTATASGIGTGAQSGTPASAASVTSSGSGTATPSATIALPGSATASGTGTASAAGVPTVTATAATSGTGTLSGTGLLAGGAAVALRDITVTTAALLARFSTTAPRPRFNTQPVASRFTTTPEDT